jgi:hypothetical protein
MPVAIIAERIKIPLGTVGKDDDPWFLNWVLRKPAEASKHVTAGYAAASSLLGRSYGSITEYYGGMGAQALILQRLFNPAVHHVVDRHPLAVEHMRASLPPPIVVHRGDARAFYQPAELAVMDYGDLTIHKAQNDHKPMLDRVFAQAPKAALLTDIAGPRLHLQRERYEEELGVSCATYPEYLAGLSAYLYKTYGYRIHACYYHRWSAVMSLLPEPGEPLITPVPEGPVGIQLQGTVNRE